MEARSISAHNRWKRLQPKRKVFRKFCAVMQFLCSIDLLPYKWDANAYELSIVGNPRNCKRFIFWCVCTLGGQLIRVAFLFFNVVALLQQPVKRSGDKYYWSKLFKLLPLLSTHSILFLFLLSIGIDYSGIGNLTNRILRIQQSRFCLTLPSSKHKKDIGVVLCILVAGLLRSSHSLLSGIFGWNRPSSMYNVVPISWRNPLTLTIYFVYVVYNSLIGFVVAYAISIPVLFFHVTKGALKELPNYKTLEDKVLALRKLQVLRVIFQIVLQRLSLPAVAIYTCMAPVYLMFVCIRFHNQIGKGVIISSGISFSVAILLAHTEFSEAGRLAPFSASVIRKTFRVSAISAISASASASKTQGVQRPNPDNVKSKKKLASDETSFSVTVPSWSEELRKIRAYQRSFGPLSVRLDGVGVIKRAQFLKVLSFIVIQTMRLLILSSKS